MFDNTKISDYFPRRLDFSFLTYSIGLTRAVSRFYRKFDGEGSVRRFEGVILYLDFARWIRSVVGKKA